MSISQSQEPSVLSCKVLVIDDDESYVKAAAHSVESRIGSKPRTAMSGDEALKLLKVESFDIILTDMMMPGLHGKELIQAIKEAQPSADIVVMTGYPERFPYVAVTEAGACDFIIKPHVQEELEAKMRRILRERELRRSMEAAELRYRSLFQRSMNGLIILHGESKCITDVNDAFLQMSGYERAGLIGVGFDTILSSDAASRFMGGVEILRRGKQGVLGDIDMLKSSGDTISVDIAISFIEVPNDPLILLSFRDTTEQRLLEEELANAANQDSLTGLQNRRSFHTRIEGAISRSLRLEEPVSLVFIDLDNFKHCNDTHGHQVGDDLLIAVADVIRSVIRGETDLGFRFGGDEFAALFMGAPSKVAEKIAERMRTSFNEGETFGTSMSMGVAQYTCGMSTQEFIKAADDALYAAKAAGKNAICVA